MNSNDGQALALRVRASLESRDLFAFGELLSDDVRWGDAKHPRACHNRSQVLATFRRALVNGLDGSINELEVGTKGILCGLNVTWPQGAPRTGESIYHVYLVRDNLISAIQRYDDRVAAAIAAGL